MYSANEYLTRVNLMAAYRPYAKTPVQKGKKVIVVGGGNVAMDAVRTAVRLGGETHLVYRRSCGEMPARRVEALHAEEEGVRFHFLTAPVEISGVGGRVTGVKCVKMRPGTSDLSGRPRPVEIPGSGFTFDCDQVILAIGTTPNRLVTQAFEGLAVNEKGMIAADPETGETSIENVYAGGDGHIGDGRGQTGGGSDAGKDEETGF